MSIERVGLPMPFVAQADDLRLFAIKARADDLVVTLPSEFFAQLVCQVREVRGDTLDARLRQKLEARVEAVNEGCRQGSCLPRKRSFAPTLCEIPVVLRLRHARPAHQRRLDSLARPVGEIEQAPALRREQPLVACARRRVYQLGPDIDRQDSHRLYTIDDEQRITTARRTPYALKVCAKA